MQNTYLEQITGGVPEMIARFVMKAKMELKYTEAKKRDPFEDSNALTENSTGLTIFVGFSLIHDYPYLDAIGDRHRCKVSQMSDSLNSRFREAQSLFEREIEASGKAILSPDFHSRVVRHVTQFFDAPKWCVFTMIGLTGPGVLQQIVAETGMVAAVFLPYDAEAATLKAANGKDHNQTVQAADTATPPRGV